MMDCLQFVHLFTDALLQCKQVDQRESGRSKLSMQDTAGQDANSQQVCSGVLLHHIGVCCLS